MCLIWIMTAILASFASGEIRISLNSDQFSGQWTVRNDTSDDRLNAKVPGGIYSDLKLFQDLFNVKNLEYRDKHSWIGYENWTYETTFELSQEVLDKVAVNLVFHGIDTVGEIFLNGKLVQSVNNMFVRYVIPIKNVAQIGYNTLEVRLKSPVLATQELSEEYGNEVPANCPSSIPHGECHINFLRKMQASFSCEVGPSVPSVGIWKSVEIEAFNTAIVRNVAATVKKANSTFLVNVVCRFEGATKYHLYLFAIKMNYSDYSFYSTYSSNSTAKLNDIRSEFNHFILNVTLKIQEDPKYVWWPSGYGSQPLWDLSCELIPPYSETKNESSILRVKTGLRTVKVVQEESSTGLPLSLKVNDVVIFARGAIWIPSHILPELASDKKTIRKLLQSARNANMNMIRVWGGGIYESDFFYQVADELGIMIWQDMMFASALYPADEKFLQIVAMEVDQQVNRLATHPSIVVWKGNYDVDEILASNRFQIKNITQYLQDFTSVFESTIEPIIKHNDDSRWYATSKLKAIHNKEENILDHSHGNDSNPWNMSSYKSAENISKYNLQSIPSLETMLKISKSGALKFSNEFLKFKQLNPEKYEEMIKIINYNLMLPKDDESKDFYETFIYYSQITQAMAKKTEIEKYRIYRSRKSNTAYKNEDTPMSALIWHLNDVWQAPSCSSIEYGGRWKMLHYYAQKFFAPVIVVPELHSNGDLIIYGISDLSFNIKGRLYIYLFSWDSMDYLDKIERRVSLVRNMMRQHSTSAILTTISLPELWVVWKNINDTDESNCFLYFRLEGDSGILAENFYYPTSFFEVSNFQPAKLTVTVKEKKSNFTNDEVGENAVEDEVIVYVDTTQVALFVWLQTEAEGVFSDNGFTMIDGRRFLSFSNGNEKIDIEKLKKTIRVRSLDLSSSPFSTSNSERLTNSLIIIILLLYIILPAIE